MDYLISSLIASSFAGVASIAAGFLFQRVTKFFKKEGERNKKEIEHIAIATQSLVSPLPSVSIDPFGILKISQKIPSGISSEQFSAFAEEVKVALREMIAAKSNATAAVENLINNYHEQALGQAQMQFWFSVGAATVGFVWILIYGASIQPENWVTASKILPGIVMDSVAFFFFRQASDTRQRATELYDRLRKDKLSADSIALVSSIEDIRVRSAVKAQLALYMSGMAPNPIDLKSFLSGDNVVLGDKGKTS